MAMESKCHGYLELKPSKSEQDINSYTNLPSFYLGAVMRESGKLAEPRAASYSGPGSACSDTASDKLLNCMRSIA